MTTLSRLTEAPGPTPASPPAHTDASASNPGSAISAAQDAWWQSRTFWKNAALIGGGALAFAGAFAISGGAVTLAASVGAELAIGSAGVYGAQALTAGALGAVGGVALGALKSGIKAISGAIREARFRDSSVAHEIAKADTHYGHELAHEAKHAMLVGFGAGTVLALGAVAFPAYVLTGLVGAVIAAGAFEVGKLATNIGALALEQRRAAKAAANGDVDAQKKHIWERDEEVEEIILNVVNLGVLGILYHSLHEIDPNDLNGITTGVAQSADEVVALAALPAEVAEAAAAAAQEIREIETAPAWLARVRRIFSRDEASA